MTGGRKRVSGRNWAIMASLWVAAVASPVIEAQAQPAIPELSGRVVDQAGILSSSTEQQLAAVLRGHEEATTNQVVVLTIASLEGEPIEEYALRASREWQLGQADLNNGVLLLVAVADRAMRIEVGYGLEGDLPDIIAKRIIDNEIRPYFRQGDFDAGVSNGVRAILGVIEGSYTPKDSSNDLDDAPLLFRFLFSTLFMGIPLIFTVISIFTSGCGRWFIFFFVMPFIGVGGTALWSPYGGVVALVLYIVGYLYLLWYIKRSPKWQRFKKKMEEARKKGKSVRVSVGGINFHVGGGSSGSGWSGGGGFSGGGGSFGGGGASGSW